MQRLFSTFADGWPGVGLLLQRLVTTIALVHCATASFKATSQFSSIAPQMVAAGAGILLFFGLWTPVVGALIAVAELWVLFSGTGDPWMPTILAMLGITLAAIGPGAWSVDARLFGRKHIETSKS